MSLPEIKVMFTLLFLCTAQLSCLATVYMVGDSYGWGPNRNYENWARGKKFTYNDTLVFKYLKGHTVHQVEMQDYLTCYTKAPIFSDASGYTAFTIPDDGEYFFVSAGFGDCQVGMKLQFNTDPWKS